MPATSLAEINRAFYEPLWRDVRLHPPEQFNTWPVVSGLLHDDAQRLEVGPGMRPRLPLAGTDFLDLCPVAVKRLREHGARAVVGTAESLPYADGSFDVVCALDIVEHVTDHTRVLGELVRVLVPGGALLLAVPLHPARWTPFDDLVGHCRRYEPGELLGLLAHHRLTVERSAPYGMQPSSTHGVALGMWLLKVFRNVSMFFYNHVGMPIALRRQKPLALTEGMLNTTGVDEVFLVCRRNPSQG